MFISVIFPLADFRGLHKNNAGRLDRPAWGNSDPQAKFARGFGSIHYRTKSGNGFVGENYYADCGNLIKYPSQFFLNPFSSLQREVLSYPVYRRFYFDGQMSGRFELGFRLNEGTIEDIRYKNGNIEYISKNIANQILNGDIQVNLLDDRILTQPFFKSMDALRDGWLLSSTKSRELAFYNIQDFGTNYVGVGRPFVFIRSGVETKVRDEKQKRILLEQNDLKLFTTRSEINENTFDIIVNTSIDSINNESGKERFSRLFYTQIRSLVFAHSFYLKQISTGRISGPKKLEPALGALIERLGNLNPLEGSREDELTCEELQRILRSADINVTQLTREIERQIKPSWWRQHLRRLSKGTLGYADRKADLAIEAAASTATKLALSGSL